MAANTYSDLKFEIIGIGNNDGTWGPIANTNIGTAIEQAIAGMATLVTGDFTANVATLVDANTNAAQNFRAFCLNITATLSAAGTVNVPAIEKPYLVLNNSVGGFAVTVKVSGQTGVSIVVGEKCTVYYNGTDYVKVATSATATGTVTSVAGTGTVNGITLTGTVTSSGSLTLGGTLSGVNLTSQVTGTLPVANGGTGAATLAANNVLLGNGTSALQTVAPGASGNVLASNGTSWVSSAPSGAAAGGGIYVNNDVISTNYTIASGQNGFSVGPMTISSGYAVTVSSGQRWVIL